LKDGRVERDDRRGPQTHTDAAEPPVDPALEPAATV